MEKRPSNHQNQNLWMVEQIIDRIKKAIDKKENVIIDFKVVCQKGRIERVDFFSEFKIAFE